MELVDDEDVETMFALYFENRSDQNAPIHLFAELAGVEPTKDLTLYGEEHGAQEPCIVAPISSYPCDQEVDSDSDPNMDEVLDDTDNEDMNDDGNINMSSIRNQIRTSQPDGGGTLVCRGCQGCNGCKMRFQTLHYPCAQVVAACDKVSLNVEQFVDDTYTLEHMLRVWENEFLVLPNLFIWEVPLMTFELIPNQGLRRNLKGHPQSSRIHNQMDIREKFNGKRCGL
ncbi:hypothetical protein GOBAR_AA01125 [Gossypium barbadense]|uniref:Uncharacterized protein n=1 Tax=Gossypium barbadense TaxID=3634 RepID=A0A2P5YV35_GOSBA|nr:hypothetical protein GOBAR_AA01125 [Gossypium barbadense]